MEKFPKIVKVTQTSNQMLRLEFDNLDLHLMHPHLMAGMGSSIQPHHKLFGLFGGSAQTYQIKIEKDGSLILNDFDVYSAEELWKNSEKITETLEEKLRRLPLIEIKYQGEEVMVWKISEEIPQFVWIHKAFEQNKVWWVEKKPDGSTRKTESNRKNAIGIKTEKGTVYGEFGKYLVRRRADDSLLLMTEKQAEKDLELIGRTQIMNAKLNGKAVEVWQIGRENPEDSWVKSAFDQKKIWWAEEIATNFSENTDGSWIDDKTKPVYRITNSDKADTLVVEDKLHGKFGDYLVKDPSDNIARILTKEQAKKELEFDN
ncbi:MAG: hypothetical protein LBV19_04395 [Streptococcaceae bacterium]|jgi:hypothetical protein|nr:hypothetical protein [Streptococcaceae bacterium]